MFDFAAEINVPSYAEDPIANVTITRFNDSVRYQERERVGGKALRTVMQECYEQYHGILSCEDAQAVEDYGVSAYVNMTALKVDVVKSYLQESIVQVKELPWIIDPTPIPTLSKRGENQVIDLVREQLFSPEYAGNLVEVVKDVAGYVRRQEQDFANKAAKNMYELMLDQCREGGWYKAMFGFVDWLTRMPYAVLHGPRPMMVQRPEWSGNSIRVQDKLIYGTTAVSPFDFWYTPDSEDTQTGAGVFVRERWDRRRLLQAAQMNSYIEANIKAVLEEVDGKPEVSVLRWLSKNPESNLDAAAWMNFSSTLDVLVHYGFFSGNELSKYRITGLDPLQYYNATVTVVRNRTVQVYIAPNPSVDTRPVFTASFYPSTNSIAGSSIPQRLRDVERCYMSSLRWLMYNGSQAASPIVEADYERLQEHMSPDDLAVIEPGTTFLASPGYGGNAPALRFYSVPSVMPAYMQQLQYFMDLGDRVTNIPVSLHGTAVGSGANRTYRGAAMLQGNAIKQIQSSVAGVDETVFGPYATLLYNYNLLYEDDDTIKGDSQIVAQGAAGIIQKEIDTQNAYELLQLLGAAGNQLAGVGNFNNTFIWALNALLENAGVPDDRLISLNMQGMVPPAASPAEFENQPGQDLPGTVEGIAV